MSSKKSKSKKEEREYYAARRRDMQLRGVRGSRIIVLRIFSAVCLCLDLYWTVYLGSRNGALNIVIPGPVLAPVALFILDSLAMWEQARIMTYGLTVGLDRTKLSAIVGCLVVALALSVTFIVNEDVFFYFLGGKKVILAICAVGIASRLILMHRINLIENNTDKQYELYRKTVDGDYKF